MTFGPLTATPSLTLWPVFFGPLNTAPYFTSSAIDVGTVGQTYAYSIAAQDDEGDTLAIAMVTPLDFLTLVDHGDGTASLSGVPVVAGDYAITLEVSDGEFVAQQSYTLTVAAVTVDAFTPAAIYTTAQATALRLLKEYGQPLKIERNTETFNPVSGTTTLGSTQQINTYGVFTKVTTDYAKTIGVTVLSGDKMVTLDPSVAPLMSDVLVISGQRWAIVHIDEINPAGTPLVYKMVVRK